VRAPRYPTLLLDLDGTLLDVDMRGFLDAFFRLAAAHFGSPGETQRVGQAMNDAALAMARASTGARTVDLVFLEAFAPAVGRTPQQVRTAFAALYADKFERLRHLVRPIPGAREFLLSARASGCELVLATNPVFFLAPILARVRWCGLADVPFALVTGAELMFWTKPHAGYFRQILAMTDRRPEQCLMVGDDPRMDMAAKEAGIATWLTVREGAVPREAPLADHRGTLGQLAAWLEKGTDPFSGA
jgi:FMN phosphatase YigB (HAD superfamily)